MLPGPPRTHSEHDPEQAVVEPSSEEMEQTGEVVAEEQPASVPEVDSPAQQPEAVDQDAVAQASAEDVDRPLQKRAAPTSAAVIWGTIAGLCAIAAGVFAVARIMNNAEDSETNGDMDELDDGERHVSFQGRCFASLTM